MRASVRVYRLFKRNGAKPEVEGGSGTQRVYGKCGFNLEELIKPFSGPFPLTLGVFGLQLVIS